jgi:hypothetical protein
MGHSLRLDEARVATPKPNGVGAWADKLRQAAFDAVKESDMTDLMGSLMKRAKDGDNNAAKLVLNYLTGGGAPPAAEAVTPEQVGKIVRAAVGELRDMMLEERIGDRPNRLEDARGDLLGVREGPEGFEVVGKISVHATEQEAEAEVRRRKEGGGQAQEELSAR